jgi:hypothetical protein
MIIARTSQVSGITRSMDLNITAQQWQDYLQGVGCIQDIFPNLTPSQREFIKTGITDEEWATLFAV